MATVHIYTDGAAKQYQYGGIGVFYGDDDFRNISEPFFLIPITNNRTELFAVIEGLRNYVRYKETPDKENVKIYTDSEYVKNLITIWIHKWKVNGWKTANGKDVKNKDLIVWLDNLITLSKDIFDIEFIHVKAHRSKKEAPSDKKSKEYKKWYGNYMADKLAVNGKKIAMKTF